MEKRNRKLAKNFLKSKVNFEELAMTTDLTPFVVYEKTPLSKVHFLFTMLGLQQVYVVSRGVVIGVITVNDFLRRVKSG